MTKFTARRGKKKESEKIELPHVRQKTEWDCGLACTLMVLQKILGNKFDNGEYERICGKKNFGTSVWTIDIASILTEYKVEYTFCTKTTGVDPGYQKNSFYEGSFDLDESRVNRLFTLGPELGLKVEKRSTSLEDIISKLKKGYVAIVLVNSNILICNWCEANCTNKLLLFTSCVCSLTPNEFCGHYVVLCGFDMDKRCFYYKNPSFNEHLCCAKFGMLEVARHSYGTDEDIIFIKVKEPATTKEFTIRNTES